MSFPSEWSELTEENKESEEDTENAEEEKVDTSQCESDVTPSQRNLIRVRNKCYETYCTDFSSRSSEIYNQYSGLLDDEAKWARNWSQMVHYLQG